MNELARNPTQIGNAIRRARKKRGLSQQALADQTGLRQATISQIEQGDVLAGVETLLIILAALDLELQIGPRSKRAVFTGE